jgi:antibiotic biosynthesis monooxygenase (ABM) superfamily enzyme
MSLGLVETVRLMAGYEWVRVLRRGEQEQRQDAQRREQWWQQARTVARQLRENYRVNGVYDWLSGEGSEFRNRPHYL